MRGMLVPVAVLVAVLAVGGCTVFRKDPDGCERVADHDPAVLDYQAKAASTPEFLRNHYDDYRRARLAAVRKCQRDRGIIPAGGGVEPYRAPR